MDGGGVSTADQTILRKYSICQGDPIGSDAFDPSLEWNGNPVNTFAYLGEHAVNCGAEDTAPSVSATYPANGATDFHVSSNLSVTFSEYVNLAADWFTLVCTTSGNVTAAVSSGQSLFTLNPDVDLVDGESCTLTILAAKVTDQDPYDPPDSMVMDHVITFGAADQCSLDYTPIYSIQGSGPTAAITGAVTTFGTVVGDFEGATPNLRGFYLQDPTGDADVTTSDGIFVNNSSNDSVSLGEMVRVSGIAADYDAQTQISSVTSIIPCGIDGNTIDSR